jgi:hypothetical protein
MAASSSAFLQYLTSRSNPRVFVMPGDSFPAGAGGVSFADSLRSATGAVVISIAAGSTTITDQIAQVQNAWWARGRKFIWWDGSPNSYGSPSAYLGNLDTLISACGGAENFGGLCPLAMGPPPGSVTLADMQAIYTGMVAKGVKTYDAQTYIASLNQAGDATSTAAGLVGPSSTQDGTHLIQSVMTSVANKFKTDVIDANGW